MKLRIAILAAFMFITVCVHAQTMDSLRSIINGGVSLTAMFDSRNSFIDARRAYIWGLKLGAEFSSKLQIGGGINIHQRNLEKTIYPEYPSLNNPVTGELKFKYFSYYMRYVYYKDKKWKFSIQPIQFGIGRSFYTYSYQDIHYRTAQRAIVLFEPAITFTYKILPWIGGGADLGYRLMIINNKDIPQNFSSPVYSFYIVVFWTEILKDVFPDNDLVKRL
ncbi:MAG: hypothetical protein Fur0041_10440 [Bacteroidia bacterium]